MSINRWMDKWCIYTMQHCCCCWCSVTKSCLILHDSMNCSKPGFPVLCYLPEFAQVYVQWVSDVIQTSYPLLPPLLLPSIFSSIRVFSNMLSLCIRLPKFGASPSVLPMNIHDWFPLGLTGLISLLSKGLSRIFSRPIVQNINSLVLGLLFGPTFTSLHDYWKDHQFNSVAESSLTLCDPMDHSMPGLPVHHHLPEFTQTHVRWVGDAIQPSHLLSSPSPAFNLSQHQGLFTWVSSLHPVARVLEF